MKKYYILERARAGISSEKIFVAYRDKERTQEIGRGNPSVLAKMIVEDSGNEQAEPVALYESHCKISRDNELHIEVLGAPETKDLVKLAEEIAIRERARERKR